MTKYWLITNIPFNKSYDNVVGFDNQAQQLNYFMSISIGGTTSNKFRIVDNVVNFRLEMSYEECVNLSYMIISQGGKHYYVFIDSVGYVDPSTTMVFGTIDVWQTYMFEYKIEDAFIGREHQDRFKKVGNKLEPIYNTELENIELGDIMQTEYNATVQDPNLKSSNLPYGVKVMWYYVVASGRFGIDSGSSPKYYNVPLSVKGYNVGYYLYAFPLASEGSLFIKHTPTNKQVNFYSRSNIDELLVDPKVISIYVSPYGPTEYTIKDRELVDVKDLTYGDYYDYIIRLTQPDNIKMLSIGSLENKVINFNIETQFELSDSVVISINDQLNFRHEPKLFIKPYTVVSFTNMTNESLDLGYNEFYPNNISYLESFGPQYKNSMFSRKLDFSNYFEIQQSTKNNEVPLLTDKYINYIMNNKASATTGVALAGVGAVAGIGIATAGLGSLPTYLGISQGISGSQSVLNELIKRRDLKQTPRSVREVGNNVVYQMELNDKALYLNIIKRRPLKEYFDKAHQYFHRMGYKSNSFGKPNLTSRYYFNFIELIDVTLTGTINQDVKTKLETIFKNGVRIWHYRGDGFRMYNYTRENWEVSLIE